MTENQNIQINRLPSLTWNWLKMNETSLNRPCIKKEGNIEIEKPESIDLIKLNEFGNHIKTGMGVGITNLLEESGIENCRITLKSGIIENRPVKMHFKMDGQSSGNLVEIFVKDNSEMTVIMDYQNVGIDVCESVIQTRIMLGKNSKLNLIQISMLGENVKLINDVGSKSDEKGRIEIIQLSIGKGDSYMGYNADLSSEDATMSCDIGYLVKNSKTLDMNYIADHSGKNTESDMNVVGVLSDCGKKLFRGTIDFKYGAVQAKGSEKEEVLLLTDDVINQTIPLILCEEEDVEGNHGASIGKIDENLLFYLQSRGMSIEAIYEMMAIAKIESVCNKIPDKKTIDMVHEYLGYGKDE